MGKRSDTKKYAQDLIAEACRILQVERDMFLQRFLSSNDWLDSLQGQSSLANYLLDQRTPVDWTSPLPVLIAPNTDLSHVNRVAQALEPAIGVSAKLVRVEFFSSAAAHPTHFALEDVGTFAL